MRTCFSTELVDLDHQAPNRNKRESKYFWDELYPLIAAADFHSLEIPYEVKWDFGGRSGIPRSLRSILVKFKTVENYKEYLKKMGIEAIDCIHLDPSLFCSGAVEGFLGATEHFAKEAIELAKGLCCPVMTLSVTPPCYAVHGILKDSGEEAETAFLEKLTAVIHELSKAAEASGVTLCIKNPYWGLLRGDKVLSFLKQLPTEVKLDVDTAHLQIAGTDSAELIKEVGNRIGVVHFTDTAFVDDQQAYLQPLPEFPAKAATKVFRDIGDGTVDFPGIMKALKEMDYHGVIVYNCKNSIDMYRSILRTRSYIDRVLI